MKAILILWILVGGTCAVLEGWALPVLEDLIQQHESLVITVGKSQPVTLRSPAERVSVVAAETADVHILEPTQLLVSGTSVGETQLIVWQENGNTRTLDVSVVWNTRQIQKVLDLVMPDEAIEVLSLDDGIALRGSVSKISTADQAVKLAQSFVPNVINLMNVPGLQQVMLKVKIAEVVRSFGDEFGIDTRFNNDSFFSGALLGDVVSGNLQSNPINISDAATLFFGFPNANFDMVFRALQEKGLLYIMAEPNLIARSGETASFLAGGEFPIPVTQNSLNSSVTIEYKEFGVRLNFTPTVIAERTVQMDISPEVSDLDFSRGLSIGGFVVPLVTTRRASTNVKLDHGQTFAIAGLIDTKKQKSNRKVPGAGSLPLLGNLFKSKNLEEVETELLIMVTPYLIAPMEEGERISMPTDVYDAEAGMVKLESETVITFPHQKAEAKTQVIEPVRIQTQALPPTQMKTHNAKPKQHLHVPQAAVQDWMDPNQFENNGKYAAKEN